MKKALVVYASKFGSVKETAKFISHQLPKKNYHITVRDVKEVKKIDEYDWIILGTAIRMDRPLKKATAFYTRFKNELAEKNYSLFCLNLTTRKNDPELKTKFIEFLEPLAQSVKNKEEIGVFAGKLIYKDLNWFWRLLVKNDKSGLMSEGDFRKWDEIKSWILNLSEKY